MLNRLTQSMDFQAQALSLRAERQRLIASNIANADTPGYVARDFNFANALRDATASLPADTLGAPITGDLLSGGPPGSAGPTLGYTRAAMTNLDSNSVDMDRERAAFADNAIKFESTLRFINGSVRNLLDAMKNYNQG